MREIFIKIKNDLSLIKDSIPIDLPYRQGAIHDIKCFERLLELANHGINGKQVRDEFNFDHFYQETYEVLNGFIGGISYRHILCTSGNMIGECPRVFKEWIWDQYNAPLLKDLNGVHTNPSRQSAIEFFGINGPIFDHLFLPHSQSEEFVYKNYRELTENSTKEEVCENMLDFLQYNIAKINQHLFD